MPFVITLAHQKGGVGKSTISLNLYRFFQKEGVKVVLVDIDPQGSNVTLAREQAIENMQVIGRDEFKDYAELQKKTASYDVVVIDTPPYLSVELIDVFGVSNLVLVPCKASLYDVFAIRQTMEFIERERVKNESLKVAIVLSQIIPMSTVHEPVREHLGRYGFPVLKTEVFNRIAYVKALSLSGGVIDEDTGRARDEMQSLAEEILEIIAN